MFKKLIAATAVLWAQLSLATFSPTHFDLETAKNRCLEQTNSPLVYFSDFHWSYTLLEMNDIFEEIYSSGKRLDYRAQYNPQTGEFRMVYPSSSKEKKWIKLEANFIASVTRQIEVAIEKGFAEYVFFPDMGHSHLYFPQDHWDAHYENVKLKPANFNKHYEKMFADKEMRPLYHLTEQLLMVDEAKNPFTDSILNFKYWHRNFLGKNDASTTYDIEVVTEQGKYNTVKEVDGFKDWSAGFAVSASKDGCFPYRDKYGNTRYFDISIKDPGIDPTKEYDNAGY